MLRTEQEYEDIFGDLIALLTGLDRDKEVIPMKQKDGTRMTLRENGTIRGFKPSDNWCSFHVKFDTQFEEPRTVETQDKVFSKRNIVVDFNFYGVDAINNILKMKSLHYTEKAYELLIAEGICYESMLQNIIDLDMMVNGQWWLRRKMSINYLEEVEIEFPVGVVEEVDQTEVQVTRTDEL